MTYMAKMEHNWFPLGREEFYIKSMLKELILTVPHSWSMDETLNSRPITPTLYNLSCLLLLREMSSQYFICVGSCHRMPDIKSSRPSNRMCHEISNEWPYRKAIVWGCWGERSDKERGRTDWKYKPREDTLRTYGCCKMSILWAVRSIFFWQNLKCRWIIKE